MHETLVTTAGKKQLEEELEHLTTVRRKEVAERIKISRGFGDIAENAEYDDAKNEQARIESRISEIEEMLRTAKVVKRATTKTVGVGSHVRVRDMKTKKLVDYWLVGASEADPLENRVSHESPIGKSLLGCEKGDEVVIEVPKGKIKYRVTSITAK